MMKQFLVLTLLFVFSFGVIAPSAFAFDCPMMNKASMAQDMSAEMPCHDPQSQDNQQDNQAGHCDGGCFCIHSSITQAQILTDHSYIHASFTRDARPDMPLYAAYSFHTSPLLKPPIQFS